MAQGGKRSSLIPQLLCAVVLGCVTGLIFGKQVSFLGEIGILLIRLLKTLAAPLLFFAIVDGFSKVHIPLRSGARLLSMSFLNASVAGLIAIGLGTFFPYRQSAFLLDFIKSSPEGLKIEPAQPLSHIDWMNHLSGLVPQNIFEPFITNNIISIILIAILIGAVLRELKKSPSHSSDLEVVERFISGGFRLISGVLSVIVRGVPLAVFAVVAKMVGISGFHFFSTLGYFVTLVGMGIVIHGLVYYSILLTFIGRVSPLQFFKDGAEALITAFGTGSSLATLPVTLRTLQDKMRISPESSRLAACVGTNFNHDGILLYEAAAALFIAQVHGISLGISQKVLLLGVSAVAAFGIAGVPDAGLITLSLVLGTLDLPLTLVPALLTVDWFVGRLRATVNVTSDMTVATLLDRFN